MKQLETRAWRRLAGLFAWVAVMASPGWIAAAPAPLDEYVLTAWTDELRSFASEVTGITQDADGYLWLATDNGLLRFDGVRFARPVPDQVLPLSSVYRSREGSVWIGPSASGIGRITGEQVRQYDDTDGFPGRRVTQFAEDPQGHVYSASRAGLFRFARDRWQRVGPADGLPDGPVYTVFCDRAGTLWAGTSAGVFRREAGQQQFRVFTESTRSYFPEFAEVPGAGVWITDPRVGLRRLDTSAGRSTAPGASRHASGTKLMADRTGRLWLATAGQGLWFVRNPTSPHADIEVLNTTNGFPADTVLSLFEDREGNIWLGGRGALYQLSPRRFTVPPDPAFRSAQAVVAGQNGEMWVAGSDRLARISGNRVRWYALDGPVRTLHVDAKGVLWIATEASVSRFVNGTVTPVPLADGAWPPAISVIAADSRGALWMWEQDYGLLRWMNGRLSPVDPAANIDHSTVNFVMADREEQIWLSIYGGGLGFFDRDHRFHLVRPSSNRRTDFAGHLDRGGSLWFSAGNRLTRVKDGAVSAFTQENGIPSKQVFAIIDDAHGHLWLGSSASLVRFDHRDIERALADANYRMEPRQYNFDADLDNGLPLRRPRAAVGPDDTLWIVTGGGLAVLDPRRFINDAPAPPVRIEHVDIDGRSLHPNQRLVVPAGARTVQIGYTAMTLVSPKTVLFQYRLEGFEGAWTDAATRRLAFYTNLPPGNYRFAVRARNVEGAWNDRVAALDFVVEPHWYQRASFPIVLLTALGCGIWGVWRLRTRRMRHEFVLVLTERVRMSRVIHDTLLQGLVAVALKLQGLMDSTGIPQDARQELTRMRREVEAYIRDARRSIWNLRSTTPDVEDLGGRLRRLAERFAEPEGLDVQLSVSGTPHLHAPQVEEQLLNIAQEAVVNVVRHASAQRIQIRLDYGADTVTLVIEDNGRGFVPEAVQHGEEPHCGLTTMRERAEEIGGTFRLSTREGAGTTIEIVVGSSSPGTAGKPAGASATFSWDPPAHSNTQGSGL